MNVIAQTAGRITGSGTGFDSPTRAFLPVGFLWRKVKRRTGKFGVSRGVAVSAYRVWFQNVPNPPRHPPAQIPWAPPSPRDASNSLLLGIRTDKGKNTLNDKIVSVLVWRVGRPSLSEDGRYLKRSAGGWSLGCVLRGVFLNGISSLSERQRGGVQSDREVSPEWRRQLDCCLCFKIINFINTWIHYRSDYREEPRGGGGWFWFNYVCVDNYSHLIS